MEFDIYQLDEVEEYDEKALERYQDALMEQFLSSPEGKAYLETRPDGGFWAAHLIYFGHVYLGVTIPQMTVEDVEEIVMVLFPRKVSLLSPEHADDLMPELIAFWEFLKREYDLPEADSILKYLHKVGDEFKRAMNDPSNFGMAKSLFMMGQSAGFDMTDEEQVSLFINLYNLAVMADAEGIDLEELLSKMDIPEVEKLLPLVKSLDIEKLALQAEHLIALDGPLPEVPSHAQRSMSGGSRRRKMASNKEKKRKRKIARATRKKQRKRRK